ncbi:carbon monoxide dehydrogenase subunit G [Streptomyces sp. LBL]|uniref:SRPBCC domain-containing protein n=1 Tax=Streptomyces sp. LBL TaxID=2940562 RepID=UPI0024735033|nr:SRPBCC domain-containing protein [Streptomyces sp. LBL]MDH6630019.1 carbon monoxide dehydrogenase subunit G [Streptomyces sp. LBL]
MEHEVFVPVPAERLRDALADPARVARAVPGLQQDAGAEPVAGQPVAGRLKVRVGSHSVTYRGAVRITGQDDGSYAVEGDATETRGTGAVELALILSVRQADGGATVRFEGTASADGRVTELPPDAVASAANRLLSRFAENLGKLATPGILGYLEGEAEGETTRGTPEAREAPKEQTAGEQAPKEPKAPEQPASEEPKAPEQPASKEPKAPEQPPPGEPPTVFEAEAESEAESEVPPSVPSPLSEGFPEAGEPPAEAAHARRTMIGRSAEEVDHAPPRGRYAPVPAPQTIAPNPVLRWAAPAAAVALASAIVVTRALRRRG